MANKTYSFIDKVFGQNKEKLIVGLIVALVIVLLVPMLSNFVSSMKIGDFYSVQFRDKEDLTQIVVDAVDEAVAPMRSDLDQFLNFYKWNEYHLLSAEVNDPDPAIAEHARRALELLGYDDPALPTD